jgi:hypothetical protein
MGVRAIRKVLEQAGQFLEPLLQVITGVEKDPKSPS